MTDWLPGVSQVKSLVQVICGDTEGAKRTQETFIRECPGVSQLTSVVQLAAGDADGALETQKRCGKRLLTTADGIPAVGHAKGLIHYAFGDVEGGNQAMKSATRTTAVMGGGVGGFVVGGPAGAVAGGMLAGGAADGATTGLESAIRDEYTPSGYFAAVENVVKNPTAGGIFDLATMPAFDGLAGYSAGQSYESYTQAQLQAKNAARVEAGKALQKKADAAFSTLEENYWSGKIKEGDYLREAKVVQRQWNQAKVMQGESLLSEADIAIAEMKGQAVKQPQKNVTVPKSEPAVVPVHTELENDKKKKEKKKCKHRVKVFYVNARSLNPSLSDKLGYLKGQIARSNPDVVAIVETWLTGRITSAEVKAALGIGSYRLIRRDRVDVGPTGARRRGGGMIVAVKEGSNLEVATSTGAYKDNFLGIELQYNCSKCGTETIEFGLLYRRASRFRGEDRETFESYSNEMWEEVNAWVSHGVLDSKIVLVGDFNFKIDANPVGNGIWPPTDMASRLLLGIPIYKGYRQYIPSATQRGLFDSLVEHGLEQVVEDATHTDGGILDLIFAHPPDFVDRITNLGQISVGSNRQDHVILFFKLQFTREYEE